MITDTIASTTSKSNSILNFGLRLAKDHILLATIGVLVIFIFLTYFIGHGNNTNFLRILLSLLGITFLIFFTFTPQPSLWRGLPGMVLILVWVSILIDDPIKLRSFVNRFLESRLEFVQTNANSASISKPFPEPHPAPSSAPASSPLSTFVDTSFSKAAASVNVGCDGSATSSVSFELPKGAELISVASSWINTSNLSGVDSATSTSGQTVTATGKISGMQSEPIAFGLRNCPGGGHGTLTVSGVIRVRSSK